jgi:hypothetical protein
MLLDPEAFLSLQRRLLDDEGLEEGLLQNLKLEMMLDYFNSYDDNDGRMAGGESKLINEDP